MRPSNVAFTTLCGLAVPSDLVSTSCTPADSTTARTAPPAMTPVPGEAGFRSTCPAPKIPRTGCGIVDPLSGIRMRFLLALSIPLAIAWGTSLALPAPYPTCPRPSPTTTSAEKRKFFPPLTTLVTELMWTTLSFSSRESGLILATIRLCGVVPARLEFQPGGPRRVRHRLDAAVIKVSAAIENHHLQTLLLEPP